MPPISLIAFPEASFDAVGRKQCRMRDAANARKGYGEGGAGIGYEAICVALDVAPDGNEAVEKKKGFGASQTLDSFA
ncbi:hypothetical protein [Paraburkholderia sp. SOS3]|uniref:hypothetical protein n=1 Tax=Paraburkholderia sp. SOS3 TaxID=1926494 RepID=UPI00094732BC|nr:hypothetical protein [Paraburkholderia sp. SOS3]APR36491.1 hypothetical protein BTO02_14905 [Paraburkholderia sp. SOS3]